MSMQMIKIHGVEDYLFDQMKHYNGIETHQFRNLNKSRTGKLRDGEKAYNHHSTYEWICLNGNLVKIIMK